MITKIATKVAAFSLKKRSLAYKIISIFCGSIFFLIFIPLLFIWGGKQIENYLAINWNQLFSLIIGLIAIFAGLSLMTWAVITQWLVGEGTPAPVAPPQHLITSGPYLLCRNPIKLGAVTYYFGVCTLACSLTVGVLAALLGLIFGSVYHKSIEEKELEMRFGEAYLEYKKKVPFLWPRIWK